MPSTGTPSRVLAFSGLASELASARVRRSTPAPGAVAVLLCCTRHLAVTPLDPIDARLGPGRPAGRTPSTAARSAVSEAGSAAAALPMIMVLACSEPADNQ